MLGIASYYTTAHSDLPVEELIRRVVENVLQASTSEGSDSIIAPARSTFEGVSDAHTYAREDVDRMSVIASAC